MVTIIDYDAGNIRSVEKAFRYLGADVCISRDKADILRADRLILPGVGAFGDARRKLDEYGLTDLVRTAASDGRPFLGICLGLQLLYEDSEESPGVPGLGLLKGHVVRFAERPGFKIPQIGWNSLDLKNNGRLFGNVADGSYVYFVHSYYVKAEDEASVKATMTYADTADVSVESGNIFGCQFHPEKSGEVGLEILKSFLKV